MVNLDYLEIDHPQNLIIPSHSKSPNPLTLPKRKDNAAEIRNHHYP